MKKRNMINWKECLEKQSKFYEHYALDVEQRKRLFDLACTLAEGSTIVELGVCNGITAVTLAYVATHKNLKYYGIDCFILENTYKGVCKLLNEAKVKAKIIEGWTNKIPWNKPIDLLLIDASHTTPYIRQDCKRWIPFVKDDGYVIFHDYENPYNKKSPHWGVRYYADLYTGSWKNIDYIDGLKIRQKTIDKPNFNFKALNYKKGVGEEKIEEEVLKIDNWETYLPSYLKLIKKSLESISTNIRLVNHIYRRLDKAGLFDDQFFRTKNEKKKTTK